MIKQHIIFILLFTLNLADANCISHAEAKKINNYIKSDKYYADVPNYIQCQKIESKLEQIVCKNNNLLLGFNLLSRANVYANENAFKKEINHQTFNRKSLQHIEDNIFKGSLSLGYKNSACYEIKRLVDGFLGGYSPFIKLQLISSTEKNSEFFAHKNEHGITILGDKNVIYLGKSCDAMDNKGNKGKWKQHNNKYYILIKDKKIIFNRNIELDNGISCI